MSEHIIDVPGQRPMPGRKFDVQEMVGIHLATVQPGTRGEQMAVALRERIRGSDAYAFWSERIYAEDVLFPSNRAAVLPCGGSYAVQVQAIAGEIRSAAGFIHA